MRPIGKTFATRWQRSSSAYGRSGAGRRGRIAGWWTCCGRKESRRPPFSLFCSYMLDVHQDRTYTGPLEDIGRTHSDILGTDEDDRFRAALDAASRDVFGVPLSEMVGFSSRRDSGEQRFPSGQRTMLWVKRNLPSA